MDEIVEKTIRNSKYYYLEKEIVILTWQRNNSML
jgi:hypothetical protein